MPPPLRNDAWQRPKPVARLNNSDSTAARKFLALCVIAVLLAAFMILKIFQIVSAGGSPDHLFWLFLISGMCIYGSYVFARVWWVLSQ